MCLHLKEHCLKYKRSGLQKAPYCALQVLERYGVRYGCLDKLKEQTPGLKCEANVDVPKTAIPQPPSKAQVSNSRLIRSDYLIINGALTNYISHNAHMHDCSERRKSKELSDK